MKNKRKLAVLIGIGIVLFFIFANALMGYQASHTLSGFFARLFGAGMGQGVETTDFVVRKLAHATEYACLGAMITILNHTPLVAKGVPQIWKTLFCLLSVGVLDEFFQSFSDRNGSVQDVVLDFLGGIFGIVVVLLSMKLISCLRKRKNKQKEGDSL